MTKRQWVKHILGSKIVNDRVTCIIFRKGLRINEEEKGTSKFIFEFFNGPVPDGKIVRHQCNKSLCCNPHHLYLADKGDKSNLNGANRTTPIEVVEKIKKLRLQNKTVNEIAISLALSPSTVSKYVESIPLTQEALKKIRAAAGAQRGQRIREKRKLLWNGSNKFKQIISDNFKDYSKNMKGSIAESAIIYRLLIHNFPVYSSIFNGHKIDVIACNRIGKLIKIQVKCIKITPDSVTPLVPVQCMQGRYTFTTYDNKDMDFLVGYDLLNDVAYVFSWDEVKSKKTHISATVESKENWGKLL
jgi:predicted transcriptional regulator